MKKILLQFADGLAFVWRLVPFRLRMTLMKGLMVLETRGQCEQGLARAYQLEDALRHVINERALVLGEGVHPKHRLTQYHAFFVERIGTGDRVLDVGCSYGAVTRSVAKAHPANEVVGVEIDRAKYERACAMPDKPANLSFFLGDATKEIPQGQWSVVILSNVLEHITDRVGFLKALVCKTTCQKLLIRVPHFEREWSMPMRRELGVNYYSDDDHKIEHTGAEFEREMTEAGLVIEEIIYRWGEIWALVLVK